MKDKNPWLFLVLTGCLLGGSLVWPTERLHAAPAPAKGKAVSQAPVSINKGNADELESVRGIGPMLAERIIKFREANGRFERIEDLIRVPGIGQAKFERIKEQISL